MPSNYQRVRRFSERLAETLTPEDSTLQSMPDASPAKWHLAHTTWFFETFLVGRFDREQSGYQAVDPAYAVLFNSYYNTVGEQFPRAQRGLISRPTLGEALDYRKRVDEAVERLEAQALFDEPEVRGILEVGLHHEQQHQELLLTDIRHALSQNPLDPVYRPEPLRDSEPTPLDWVAFDGGVVPIGHTGEGFAYDNEYPRHDALVPPFELATRPVTCGEYQQFIRDGGYETPMHWLAEGWATVQAEGWRGPLYWRREPDGEYTQFTLAGRVPIDPHAPVTCLSYFEADAYARWVGARLPTEQEWETACLAPPATGGLQENQPVRGGFVDELLEASQGVQPALAGVCGGGQDKKFTTPLVAMRGEVWEWTASPYTPYPGYRAAEGALGEYNGKFMVNQQVLRGGSCATSSDHLRATYRNFFPTSARWQFSGVRLAR
ncbi:Iron(II)-dependent oxidoreductase EgtB [Planctomycetes bacterium MalM25]|nr:Iron(II)-dependent oxidoreductase EgtB [Planctomycetes bacterium MalM25]